MTSEQEKKALLGVLGKRLASARRLSLGLVPNVFILVSNNEFVQMVGHDLLRGSFEVPRYSGFRVKVRPHE